LDREPLPGPAHSRLDLVVDQEDLVLVEDGLEGRVPALRRHDVTALSHHGFRDEGSDVLGRDRRLEIELLQDLRAVEVTARILELVRAAIATRRGDVVTSADVRTEPGPLDRFRSGHREGS